MTHDALIGLVMLIVMVGTIFVGFPISFTLLFLALAFGYFSLGEVVFSLAYFQTIGMMKEELFAAVPLFIFLIVSWNEGWYAFQIGETSEQTPWRPILWPFKMVVPLACLLLLIQGVSETIKSVYAARTGIRLEHKEKVEV